jgi:hypothetical protein
MILPIAQRQAPLLLSRGDLMPQRSGVLLVLQVPWKIHGESSGRFSVMKEMGKMAENGSFNMF